MHGGVFIIARLRVLQGLTENRDNMQKKKTCSNIVCRYCWSYWVQKDEREGIRRV